MDQKELEHSTFEDDHVSVWNRYSVVEDRKGDYVVGRYLISSVLDLVPLATLPRRKWPMMRHG